MLPEGTLWDATAPPGALWPSLTDAEECDIAIIGAGVIGLSLALHLAERGLRPVLLEADAEAAGGAGRSAGVVAPQLVRHTPDSVIKAFGPARGDKFLRLVADGGTTVFSLIGAQTAVCGARQAGFIAPARGAAGALRVDAIARGWAAWRPDLQRLDGPAVERITGCVGYDAAIYDPTGGALNPLAYLRLLAREAAAQGASIFTRSPVLSVSRQQGRWRLATPRGSLSARLVVAAANRGNAPLHPSLRRVTLTMPVCQVATEPLAADQRQALLPGGEAMTDMQPDVLSLRQDPDGRLITAYPIGANGHHAATLEGLINDRLEAALPFYRRGKLAFAWTGLAVLTPNFLPRLFSVDEDFLAVQACNGRGLALGSVIGRDLAAWIAGGRQAGWALEPEVPRPIAGYLVAQYLPLALMKLALWKQMLGGPKASRQE